MPTAFVEIPELADAYQGSLPKLIGAPRAM
jgi:hypothetical protein